MRKMCWQLGLLVIPIEGLNFALMWLKVQQSMDNKESINKELRPLAFLCGEG